MDAAVLEIDDAYVWYEEKRVGQGEKFLDEIDKYEILISKNPYQFNINYSKNLHFATLKIFPFRIVYEIDTTTNTVFVASVFHTSRDPDKFL